LDRWLKGRPSEERKLTLQRVRAALKANWEHQMMHAPVLLRPKGPLAYSFDYGAAAFFVLDTRTRRVMNREGRDMLDKSQWQALTNWLRRVKDTHPIKFIVTSIAFLSEIYGDGTADRWSGWKQERDRVLYLIAAERIEGIHFLAGDLHSAHSISADIRGVDGKLTPIWEFCSSPFEQICNPYAWLLDHPARSAALRNQKMHFIVSAINYGLVTVDYAKSENTRVTFELHYQNGEQWLTKTS
jgi:phosphodiesterase/alkaline phosphatase D-like protein